MSNRPVLHASETRYSNKAWLPMVINDKQEALQKLTQWKFACKAMTLKTTAYFDNFASQKHSEVHREWISYVLASPVKVERQPNNRMSYWGNIPEAKNRVLRVITLEDGETVHNAFFDRNFYKRQQRGQEPQ